MIIACDVAEAIGILSFHVKLLLRSCCSETSSDTSSRPGGTHYAAAVQRLFALLISPGSKLLCYSVACVFFRPQIGLRSCCRQSLEHNCERGGACTDRRAMQVAAGRLQQGLRGECSAVLAHRDLAPPPLRLRNAPALRGCINWTHACRRAAREHGIRQCGARADQHQRQHQRQHQPQHQNKQSSSLVRPVRQTARAFAPATVANLGVGFDWLGCAVEVPMHSHVHTPMHTCTRCSGMCGVTTCSCPPLLIQKCRQSRAGEWPAELHDSTALQRKVVHLDQMSDLLTFNTTTACEHHLLGCSSVSSHSPQVRSPRGHGACDAQMDDTTWFAALRRHCSCKHPYCTRNSAQNCIQSGIAHT